MAGTKFWVQIGGERYPCAFAKRLRGSRLHFDLYNGTTVLALHGEWKLVDKPRYLENRSVTESENPARSSVNLPPRVPLAHYCEIGTYPGGSVEVTGAAEIGSRWACWHFVMATLTSESVASWGKRIT